MGGGLNYYKHFIGDFQRDTGHLSLTERGAYLALMHHYYATEQALPLDHAALCRIASAFSKAERDAVKVAMKFFEQRDGALWHKRIEAELEKSEGKSDTNRRIALEREARKRAEKVASSDHELITKRAPDVPSSLHEQSTPHTQTHSSLRSEDISSGSAESKYPAEFEAVWLAYPDRPGRSKADACKAWKARRKDGVSVEALLTGVQRYAAYCRVCKTEPGFIKQPTTFFGPGEHYLADWTAPAPSVAVQRPAFGANKFTAAAAGIFDAPQHQGEVIDV